MTNSSFWHPFADMAMIGSDSFKITHAEGVWVWDSQNNKYLDGTASLWYMNIGHGRNEMIDAIAEQGRRVAAYSCFGDYSNEPAELLTERLASLFPVPDAKIFLASGGGDAIDTAVKLARLHFSITGLPDKVQVISREGSYHGTHGIGTSIAGIAANRTGFGPLVQGAAIVARDDPGALRAKIEELGADHVACFILEPVIGAGGVYPPTVGYIEETRRICRESQVLFVADSVICGFGRLGTWFGIERFQVLPDMVVFAKGITSGYIPLGGVLISSEVSEPFFGTRGNVFRHGQTYAGHPLACAAAIRNMEIIERENLLDRSNKLEGPLFDALKKVEKASIVGEVRGGVGLMAAAELGSDFLAGHPDGATQLQMAMRKRGVLVRPLGGAIAVSPPLVIDEAEISLIGSALSDSIDELERDA